MRITGISFWAGLVTAALAAWAAAPSSAPTTAPLAPKLEPFTHLPPPASRPAVSPQDRLRIRPGTDGLALPTPPSAGARTTIAILGDLAPGDADERESYLRMAVSEINLLRPEAVLSVGNLIPGLTRSGPRWVQDVQHTRELLDTLKMPWLPCVGQTDVVSGTRLPASDVPAGGGAGATTDRRFEELYRGYVGPLYFSADIGGTDNMGGFHAIVLDSEEGVGSGSTLGDTQLRWLEQDLDHTFDSGRAQGVIVLLHRPLWQYKEGNWLKAHDLLVRFNRRPIASFEGGGTASLAAHGPRVLAVFAGARRSYDQEPPRDGIRYAVLGPTAAAPRDGESAAETLRHFTLLKLDASGDLHLALVQLGGEGAANAPMILPEDTITDKERAVLDAIAGWDEQTLGIDGVVDERGEPVAGKRLSFHVANPLPEPLDVELRLAPGGWDFTGPAIQRHLSAAGVNAASASADFALRRLRAGADRPVVEAVIRWADSRGRVHEIVHPRPVAVSPAIEIPVADKPVPLEGDDGWAGAPASVATAWNPAAGVPRKSDPALSLRADGDRVLVRVHVTDDTGSYWPSMKLEPAWGGLPSDGVSVAWARGTQMQRVWVLPFAPKSADGTIALWSNTGLGDKQTPLERLDPKSGVQAAVKLETGGYTVTLALPRKLICDEIPPATQPVSLLPMIPLFPQPVPAPRLAATATLNVAVHDNDETARTWTKSWTREEAGLPACARIELLQSPAASHGP